MKCILMRCCTWFDNSPQTGCGVWRRVAAFLPLFIALRKWLMMRDGFFSFIFNGDWYVF